MRNQIRQDLHAINYNSFPYVCEQTVTVQLKSRSGLIRCNIYRSKDYEEEKKVPVLVTYDPYGKDIQHKEYSPSLSSVHRFTIDVPFEGLIMH
jgi:hypothetical protein